MAQKNETYKSSSGISSPSDNLPSQDESSHYQTHERTKDDNATLAPATTPAVPIPAPANFHGYAELSNNTPFWKTEGFKSFIKETRSKIAPAVVQPRNPIVDRTPGTNYAPTKLSRAPQTSKSLEAQIRRDVVKQVGYIPPGASKEDIKNFVDTKVKAELDRLQPPRYTFLKDGTPVYLNKEDERKAYLASIKDQPPVQRYWSQLKYDIPNKIIGLLAAAGAPATRAKEYITDTSDPTNAIGPALQTVLNAGILGSEYIRTGLGKLSLPQYLQQLKEANKQLEIATQSGDPTAIKAAQDEIALQQSYVDKAIAADKENQLRVHAATQAIQNSWAQFNDVKEYMKQHQDVSKALSARGVQGMQMRLDYFNQEKEAQAQAAQQATTLRTNAQQAYITGDFTKAIDLIKQAQASDRMAEDGDSYGAYTWVREPDKYNAFLEDTALAEIQKGSPLTVEEIRRIKEYHVNSWTEMTGEVVYDPLNLVPAQILEDAFKLTGKGIKAVGGALYEVPGIGKTVDVLSSPIKWLMRESVTSGGNRVARETHNVLERFMQAYTTNTDMVRALDQASNVVLDASRAPTEEAAKAIFNAKRAEVQGLQNLAFPDFKKLMDAGQHLDPTTWGKMYDDALKSAEDFMTIAAEKQGVEVASLVSDTSKSRRAMMDMSSEFYKAFVDPHRIYKGAAFTDDTIMGWVTKTMRELSGAEINDMLKLSGFDETALKLGETLSPKAKQLVSGAERALEGVLHVSALVRDVWATTVLSTPRWIVNNLLDTGMRDLVYGGNLWDDLTALFTSTQRTLADDLGFVPLEFSQALSRADLDITQSVPSRLLYEGYKPTAGPFSYWAAEYNRLLEADHVVAKRKVLDGLLDGMKPGGLKNTVAWLGDGLNVKMPTLLKAWQGGLADFNTAIEFTFRLRMFHREYFKLLETLEPQFLAKGLENLSPATREIAQQIWNAAEGNPSRLSGLVDDITGAVRKGTPAEWSVLVPNNIKKLTEGMDATSQQLFVSQVKQSLNEMIKDAPVGKRLTSEDFTKFFDNYKSKLQDEIQAHISQSWDKRLIDTTIGKDGVTASVPEVSDLGGSAPKEIKTLPQDVAIEQATKKIRRGGKFQTSTDVIENFSTAVSKYANVERVSGDGVRLVTREGKQVIEIGDNVLKQGTKGLYPRLHDAMLDLFKATDTDIVLRSGFESLEEYDQVIREFIKDPTAVLAKNEKQFATIADRFTNHPQLTDLLSRTASKPFDFDSALDVYRNIGVFDNAYGFSRPSDEILQELANTKLQQPGYYVSAAEERGLATSKLMRMQFDESTISISESLKAKLGELRNNMDAYGKQLHQFYTFTYPGPKRFSGATRNQAWETFFQEGAANYLRDAKIKNTLADLLTSDPVAAEKYIDDALNNFPEFYLKENGIKVTWDQDHLKILETEITTHTGRKLRYTSDLDSVNVETRFFSNKINKELKENPLLRVDKKGVPDVKRQLTMTLRDTFNVPTNRAEAWAKTIDNHAQKWAEVTGQDVERYYDRLGFQKLDTGYGLASQQSFRTVNRGAIQRTADGQFIFYGLGQSNFESMVRESSELFYDDYVSMARYNDQIAADLKALNDHIEQVTGKPVRFDHLDPEQSKVFNDLFTQYIGTGRGPKISLKRPMENYKSWMVDAFKGAEGTPVANELSDDIYRRLNNMFVESKMKVSPTSSSRVTKIMAEEAGLDFADDDAKLLDYINEKVATSEPTLTPELKAQRDLLEQNMLTARENFNAAQEQMSGNLNMLDDQMMTASAMQQADELTRPAQDTYQAAQKALDDFDAQFKAAPRPATPEVPQGVINADKEIYQQAKKNPQLAKKLKADIPQVERRAARSVIPDDKRKSLYQRTVEAWDNLSREEQIQTGAGKWIDEQTSLENKGAFLRDAVDGKNPPPGMSNTVIDANSLTAMNFNGGHTAGDAFIKEIGNQINEVVDEILGKGNGRRFRYGGDEFVIWHEDPNIGKQIGEALDKRFEQVKIYVTDDNGVESVIQGVSISHGTGDTFDAADKALYENKKFKSELGYRPAMGPGVDKNTLPPRVSITPTEVQPQDLALGNAADLTPQPTQVPRVVKPKKTYPKLSDVPEDVAARIFGTDGAPLESKVSKELDEAWDTWKTRNQIQGFPEEVTTSPAAFKQYLQTRIDGEWSEAAWQYNRMLAEVENFEHAMMNYHYGDKFATTFAPRVDTPAISDGMKTWIRNNEQMLNNYEAALRTLDEWKAHMGNIAEGNHPINAMTTAQKAELAKWGQSAAGDKANMINMLLNGGSFNGREYEGAVNQVNRVMLDYQHRNVFDQFMKNIFPFWMFPSRSMPFWMQTMATHPQLIAAYEKIQRMSRTQRYQAGAVTSKGIPLPSLDGYVQIPGSDMWFNPLAPFSFRYLLDVSKTKDDAIWAAQAAQDDIDPQSYIAKEFMANSQIYGFTPAPWISFLMKKAFNLPDNVVPQYPLIPQISLMPRWVVQDMIHKANKMNVFGQTGWGDAVYPEVKWHDYLVEQKIYQDTMVQLRSGNLTQAQKDKLRVDLENTIKNKNTPLWEQAYKDVTNDEAVRSAGSFFTGIYAKQFTDGQAELLAVRNNLNLLKSALNNEFQTQVFGLPSDAQQAYANYLKQLDTDEGWVYRLYTDSGWVKDESGHLITDPNERNKWLAIQIQQDQNQRLYYQRMTDLQSEYNERLRAMPIGATYQQLQPIYDWYSKERHSLDYLRTPIDTASTNKPQALIEKQVTDEWFRTINEFKPRWNTEKGETYQDYQARVAEWEKNIANVAPRIMADFQRKPDIEKLLHALRPDQKFNEGFFTQLTQQTTPDGIAEWKKSDDDIFDALNNAWKELYFNEYWDAGVTAGGYAGDLAEQDFLTKHPTPPSGGELYMWIKANYGERFSREDVLKYAEDAGAYTVEERNLADKPADTKMRNDIWDMLSWLGPGSANRKAFESAYTKAGGDLDQLTAWYAESGKAFTTDPTKLNTLYNNIKSTMSVLDLTPPSREELVQYVEAQSQNESFQHLITSELGESFYDLLGYYNSLSSADKKSFRGESPEMYSTIQDYYNFKDQYAADHPIWAGYYGPDAQPTTANVETTSATYTGGSFVKPSIVRHDRPEVKSGSVPLPRKPGTGYGYEKFTYNPKPYFGIVGRTELQNFSSLPPAFLKAAGTSLTWEIGQALQNNRPISNAGRSYLTNLRSRHPEWESAIDSILSQ